MKKLQEIIKILEELRKEYKKVLNFLALIPKEHKQKQVVRPYIKEVSALCTLSLPLLPLRRCRTIAEGEDEGGGKQIKQCPEQCKRHTPHHYLSPRGRG